jgi:uncharacterized protein
MSAVRTSVPFIMTACLFSGCKTSTVHLYTLVPPPTVSPSHAAASPARDPFVIEAVLIPRMVDRKEIVLRKSDHEIVLLENDHWAAPLREEVRHGLTTDLQLALAGQSSAAPNGPSPVASIWIQIRDWEATTHTVYINAEWRLRRGASPESLDIRCQREFMEPTSGNVEDLVRADQALLADLAQAIARALRTSSSGGCD